MKTWQQFKRRDGRISTDSMQIDQKLYEEIQRDAIDSLAPQLQVLASTFPIPENAGEVKAALERYINTMKTPHEQCAEEIELFCFPSDSINGNRLRAILSKYFPQPPASTHSLDEVVDKCPYCEDGFIPTGDGYGVKPCDKCKPVATHCRICAGIILPKTGAEAHEICIKIEDERKASTSLDEVVDKWMNKRNSEDGFSTEDAMRFAILEYNALLIQENKKLNLEIDKLKS